jgi:ferredoxin
MSYAAMEHIPLSSAYLCQDCNSVGNCSRQCPACASSVLIALATVLDREEEDSRVLAFDYREALAA